MALRGAMAALLPSWIAWTASVAVVGWVVFSATGSPTAVGLAFTLRLAPLLVAGIPAGALSDRIGHRKVLQASNGLAALIALAMAGFASHDDPSVPLLMTVSCAFGVADAGRMVGNANLAYALSGKRGPTHALALTSLVSGIGQTIGGVVGGFALERGGPALTSVAIALGFGATALLLGLVTDAPDTTRPTSTVAVSFRHGIDLLRDAPVIRALIVVAIVTEVLGFSSVAVDPVFAGAVFGAGPAGLGLLLAARAIGRLGGAAALMVMRPRIWVGRSLALAIVGLGTSLVAYAVSPGLLFAVPLVALAGVSGVVVDALEQTALQAGVAHGLRGRVTGLWVLALGFGPIGVLEIGAIAQLSGARVAQGLDGALVALFGLALLSGGIGRRISQIPLDARDAAH